MWSAESLSKPVLHGPMFPEEMQMMVGSTSRILSTTQFCLRT